MSDPASLLLLLVLLLALIGALRFDLMGLIWREWLKLGNKGNALPPADSAHGPYQGRSGHLPHRGPATAHKPDFHRSGRRG